MRGHTLVIILISFLAPGNSAPAFNNVPGTAYIPETQVTPMIVVTADAYGINQPFTYSIDWGQSSPISGNAPFEIDATNGSIIFNVNYQLNFDVRPDYTIHVCARDVMLDETCGDMKIVVENFPNVPTWASLPATVVIPEDTPINSVIHDCVAYDQDLGDILYYSIKSQIPSPAPITLQPLTGAITSTGMFDFESRSQYQVTVNVTDGTTPKFAILTIEVTDVNEVPDLDLPATVTIPENTPSGLWYKQENTDPEGDAVTYNIACVPAACPFRIDTATGDISIDDTIAPLDFETVNAWQMTVTIADGTDTLTRVLDIQLTDINEPPVFLNLDDWMFVPEDTVLATNPANPNFFTVLMDDEENDDLEFFITVQPDPGTISIDKDTGVMSYTAAPGFNYEKEPLHTIVVHVTDGTTMVGPRYYYLNVTDEREPPIIKNLPHSMCLSDEIEDTISFFGLVWDDEDESPNDVWKTTITGGPFGISNNTGKIFTNGNPNFDFNTVQTYTTTVTVEDRYGLSDSETLTICVGSQSPKGPKFSVVGPDKVFPNEERTIGQTLTGIDLTATDRDLNNGDVLTWTMETTPGSENFFMDTSTNPPTVKWNAVIDREAISGPIFYNLKFTVTDTMPGETDVKWATVIVQDLNDHSPDFLKSRYTETIPENNPVNSYVLTVSATDADKYLGDPVYSISPASTLGNTYFKIHANTGVITVKSPPDYETVQSVTFDVVATDAGGLTDTSQVVITITDLNDNAPVFDSLYYNFEVPAGAPVDFAVGKISATDVDTVGTNLYFLESVSGEFYLENRTGVIRVKNQWVLVNHTEYTLKAVVRDTETVPHKSLTATIRIDAYPACLYTVSVDVNKVASYFPTVSSLSGFTVTNMEYFIQEMAGLLPSGAVGRIVTIDEQEWPIFDGIGKGKSISKLKVLFLADANTQVISSVNSQVKNYLTTTEVLSVLKAQDPKLLKDNKNAPSKALTAEVGSSFPVEQIWETEACPAAPLHWWTQTPEGIATQSLIAMACLLGLGTLLGLFMYMCGRRLLFGPYPKCPNWKEIFSNCCKKKPPPPVKSKPPPAPPKGDDKLPDFRYAKKDPAKYFKNYDPNVADERGPRDTMTPSNIKVVV